MAAAHSIISIGYEKRSPAELLAILQNHSVSVLIDVREAPISRRKGFSKTALSSLLASVGITYIHLRAAGNPYRKLKQDTDHCLQLYTEHLISHPEVVELLSHTLPPGTSAVLCYERSHEMCHRSILLGALAAQTSAPEVIQVS